MVEMTQSTRSSSETKKSTSSSSEMKPRPKLVASKSMSGSLSVGSGLLNRGGRGMGDRRVDGLDGEVRRDLGERIFGREVRVGVPVADASVRGLLGEERRETEGLTD
ncbi:polyribonucleotide nucleotidyltransferase 1 [Pyrus ussuriensis x Pyrus communis]|uniref:Polyribonucleotide nucleotidyltransferase 1 n=1 Tax=Pyrus ussuriensis x Pyrus communis TaxID=2448454 RepID=A0A5N5FV62_9ROSA|nr:polyribonucleotide nucleotidyltransferase 1 [Pyrus ussuriensis x Pyrus communis]